MSDAGEEDGETIVLTRATAGYQQSTSNHAHADQKHKLYGRRWAMLALYAALAATNQLQWITFGPISSVCQDFYGVSALQINTLSMIFMLVYIPGSFLGARYADVRGSREALLLAAFFNALGSGVRTSGSNTNHRSYEVVVVGQVIVSLTQCIVFAMPSKLAVIWFPLEEQGVAVAIGWAGTYLGTAIGFFVPPLTVTASNANSALPQLMLAYTLLNTAVLVLLAIFFQSAPPSPPSVLAERGQHGEVLHSESEGLRRLLSNKPFLLLFAGFTTFVGITYAFGTVIEDLWSFELSSGEIGQLGLLQVLAGTAGVFLMGPVLDCTHAYHRLNIILATAATIAIFGMALAAHLSIKWLTFASSMLFGFTATGMNSTAMEFAMELTYPSKEEFVSTILMAGCQVTGLVFTVIMTVLQQEGELQRSPMADAVFVLFGVGVLGACAVCCAEGELRRTEAAGRGAPQLADGDGGGGGDSSAQTAVC